MDVIVYQMLTETALDWTNTAVSCPFKKTDLYPVHCALVTWIPFDILCENNFQFCRCTLQSSFIRNKLSCAASSKIYHNSSKLLSLSIDNSSQQLPDT